MATDAKIKAAEKAARALERAIKAAAFGAAGECLRLVAELRRLLAQADGKDVPTSAFVEVLRQRRRAANITQAALAKAADTTQSVIADMERGRFEATPETLRRVRDALRKLGG